MNSEFYLNRWNLLDRCIWAVLTLFGITKLFESFMIYYGIGVPFWGKDENMLIIKLFSHLVPLVPILLIYCIIIGIIRKKYNIRSVKSEGSLGILFVFIIFLVYSYTGVIEYCDSIFSQFPAPHLYAIFYFIESIICILLSLLLLRRGYHEMINKNEQQLSLDLRSQSLSEREFTGNKL
jgi:hypothetical protein